MHRFILNLSIFIFLIKIISCQEQYPLTPIAFRGLWCISNWSDNQPNASTQIGQALFYNNGTFTINLLPNINYTWINHFIAINKTDNQGTYQIFTDTTQGPATYVNKTSCFWRRQIDNMNLVWGRQSNGSCTPSFERDTIRYTRSTSNCLYIDDEGGHEILSNTPFERELLQFDRSLVDIKYESIVFYGSSTIRLWSTLSNDFSNIPYGVINRGFGGSTLKQCWQQFKRIISPLEPRLLIVYAGENDIAEGQTPESVRIIFRQFISTTRQFYPSLSIAFISIKPSPSRFNQIVQMNMTNNFIREDIKSMNNVYYIDIFNDMLTVDGVPRSELFLSDNLHMNEKGYAIWARAVQNYLQTNGFISKGLIHSEISFVILAMNLFIVYLFI